MIELEIHMMQARNPIVVIIFVNRYDITLKMNLNYPISLGNFSPSI